MRILVFGGSFDPPHKGHAALLDAAARQLRPDRILVVPAFQAPLKGRPGASAADRLRLIRLGLLPALPKKWRKRTRVELSEIKSRKQIFTIDTLSNLKRRYSNAELNFVTGADSAATFNLWKNPAGLKKLALWWTATRPGADEKIPSFFSRIEGRMPDVSSTEVRHRLAIGEGVDDLLSPLVRKSIARRKLYGVRLLERLEVSLKSSRLEHVLCVAELAESLARRWNQDADKARLAGLLHDLGRSIPIPEMPSFARRHRVKVPDLKGIEAQNPALAHAHLSEHLARKMGYTDPELLSAVRKHTLGDGHMAPLDRLLFVADACSSDRNYDGVERLRELAFKNLDLAFSAVVKDKLGHVKKKGHWLHPNARRLWNSLRK